MNEIVKLVEVPLYEPEISKKYRVGITYEDQYLPLFWVEVKKDGSVYMGSSQKESKFFATGSGTINDGQVSVKYADAKPIKNIEDYNNPSKVSFHSSHIVTTMGGKGERYEKISHRFLEQGFLLCTYLFRHPRGMNRKLKELRTTDVCINYKLNEERPLQAYVYIEQSSAGLSPIQVNSATDQISLVFQYRNLENCNDFRLQIILAHGPKGEWPPYTYKLFPVLKRDGAS